MRKRFRKFLYLSFPQKLLFIESMLNLVIAMVAVKVLPFRWWSRFLGKEVGQVGEDRPANPEQVIQCLERVSRPIKQINNAFDGRFTCLMQAVAGKLLLNRRGFSNILVLGVLMDRQPNGEIEMKAHAWLESHSIILLGGEVHQDYTVVAQFYSKAKVHERNSRSS